jgi:hypothetical protein
MGGKTGFGGAGATGDGEGALTSDGGGDGTGVFAAGGGGTGAFAVGRGGREVFTAGVAGGSGMFNPAGGGVPGLKPKAGGAPFGGRTARDGAEAGGSPKGIAGGKLAAGGSASESGPGGRLGRLIRDVSFSTGTVGRGGVRGGKVMRTVSFFGSFRSAITTGTKFSPG